MAGSRGRVGISHPASIKSITCMPKNVYWWLLINHLEELQSQVKSLATKPIMGEALALSNNRHLLTWSRWSGTSSAEPLFGVGTTFTNVAFLGLRTWKGDTHTTGKMWSLKFRMSWAICSRRKVYKIVKPGESVPGNWCSCGRWEWGKRCMVCESTILKRRNPRHRNWRLLPDA